MSAPAISLSSVPVTALKTELSNDAALAEMEVAGRALQKDSDGNVYYLMIDQADSSAGPAIVIGLPVLHDSAGRKNPNGPGVLAADFRVKVIIHAQDVKPDNADMVAMQRYIEGLEGRTFDVPGGRVACVTIYDWPSRYVDDGTYGRAELGVEFLIAAQLN